MTGRCLVCLGDLPDDVDYHRRCAPRLFGSSRVPTIDVELAKLHTLAGAMVEHTSISGTQRKISLGFTQDRARLRVPEIGGEYILKPQTGVFPALPENEHLTMRIAQLFGLEVPPCGLVRLLDGTLAYLIARFDRPKGGGKLRQEDFCQLSLRPPKDKYRGSAELCARLIKDYSGQPGVDLLRLYRRLVFSWWVANGDLHLKNLSLLEAADGGHQLSPVYDMLSTRLVIDDDRTALQMGGRDRAFTRRHWLEFAGYSDVPRRAAERVLAQPARVLERAESLIDRSFLPPDMQATYLGVVRDRLSSFAA